MNVRDLAANLGLSKTTVATALQGGPGVSAATRERVVQAAKNLGYKPNAIASIFYRQIRARERSKFQANVALIFDTDSAPKPWDTPWTPSISTSTPARP
jgi:LacI family transcriptional regulator